MSRGAVLWIFAGSLVFTIVWLGALIWLRQRKPETLERFYRWFLSFYGAGGEAAGKAIAGPWPKQRRSGDRSEDGPEGLRKGGGSKR